MQSLPMLGGYLQLYMLLLVIVTYSPAKGVEASTPGSQWMSEGADVARMSATVEEKVERVQQFLLALRVHRIFVSIR